MQQTQETDLIQGLQAMVAWYMSRNPQLTLNALASRSNIPVTTLRRLMNGEQKNEIAPHSVLNLVSYIHREKNLQALLQKLEQSIADFLRRHFGHFIFSSESRVYSIDLNQELQDQTKYLIYKLAANHNGTDLLTITENFGSFGKKKAEEMQQTGLLLESEGRLHARDKNFSLDLSVAASHLPALAGLYKPERVADGHNSFFSLSESLTQEAIAEIRTVQRQCVQRIHEIMSASENLGEIPYFTLNLSETLLSEHHLGEMQ
jgi:hypothetical protein